MNDYNPILKDADKRIAQLLIDEAEKLSIKAEDAITEALTISDSFDLWSINFMEREEFESLHSAHRTFLLDCSLLIIIASDSKAKSIPQEIWVPYAEEMNDSY